MGLGARVLKREQALIYVGIEQKLDLHVQVLYGHIPERQISSPTTGAGRAGPGVTSGSDGRSEFRSEFRGWGLSLEVLSSPFLTAD